MLYLPGAVLRRVADCDDSRERLARGFRNASGDPARR